MELSTRRWDAVRGWDAPLPAGDGAGTLVLALVGHLLLDPGPALADLRAAYPTSVVTGCSTAGTVVGGALDDASVVVTVVRFAGVRLALAHAPVSTEDSRAVGADLGERLLAAGPDLTAVLVLSDGLGADGNALAEGLEEGSGHRAVVVGGLAGDGFRYGETWVLVDGVRRGGAAVAVGLFGEALEVSTGSRGGWTVLGPERVITRSAGKVLHELDGRPALELYRRYLGDHAAALPGSASLFPLSVRWPGPGGVELVRTVHTVDEATGSLGFAGDIPEGATATLLRGTTERLVDAAHAAASSAASAWEPAVPDAAGGPDGPVLALVISCVARRQYLGQRAEDELEAVVEALGPDASVVGFYSYGELTPTGDGACHLHNQTMTVALLRERAS